MTSWTEYLFASSNSLKNSFSLLWLLCWPSSWEVGWSLLEWGCWLSPILFSHFFVSFSSSSGVRLLPRGGVYFNVEVSRSLLCVCILDALDEKASSFVVTLFFSNLIDPSRKEKGVRTKKGNILSHSHSPSFSLFVARWWWWRDGVRVVCRGKDEERKAERVCVCVCEKERERERNQSNRSTLL